MWFLVGALEGGNEAPNKGTFSFAVAVPPCVDAGSFTLELITSQQEIEQAQAHVAVTGKQESHQKGIEAFFAELC